MKFFLAAVATAHGALAPYDDFHYPSEEGAERASAPLPICISSSGASAVLRDASSGVTSPALVEGAIAFGVWHVLLVDGYVAVERNFARWGVIAMLPCSANGGAPPLYVGRKAVGALDTIVQPMFNLTRDVGPNYWSDVASSHRDYAMDLALANLTVDGEPTFSAVARMLAPQRDVAEISNPNDVTKFVVTHNGRVKCASRPGGEGDHNTGVIDGTAEHTNMQLPPPNSQTIVFDPATYASYWPVVFDNMKMGLVGNRGVANVGAFSAGTGEGGFELVAFSPVVAPLLGANPSSAPPPPCDWSAAHANSYLATFVPSGATAPTLAAAQALCVKDWHCGGVTQQYGTFSLRVGPAVIPNPVGIPPSTAWAITNLAQCRGTFPRIAGLNYQGSVYVRFREQRVASPSAEASAEEWTFGYYVASNKSEAVPSGHGVVRNATAAEFYGALLEHEQWHASTYGGGMSLDVPDEERRVTDVANAALQLGANNYVGNQSNYGNGATYWSYGREDNGSLILNNIAVDGALLSWGKCSVALPHIGFYLENNINPDGTINYWGWGAGNRDSLADYGRLAELYLKAVRTCRDMEWAKAHLPAILRVAGKLLAMRAIADAPSKAPCTCCAGMVIGAPEHDYGADTTHYYFNVNVWTLRGLVMLGNFLAAPAVGGAPALNATLGSALLGAAKTFAPQLAASVACSVVADATGAPYFLPPRANATFTPYPSLSGSRDSSYANFRFWAETLVADVLPRPIENVLLEWHNGHGGRVGGANRFMGWLDDMPTTGWGYGALTSNRTGDFLALLYGHMATYHSRGTFHTTEQLSYQGQGRYRDWLHLVDPPLPRSPFFSEAPLAEALPATESDATGVRALSKRGGPPAAAGLGYYSSENDISYCIVSGQLIPKMVRWMVVFDDFYRFDTLLTTTHSARVWLGRGVPKRWFKRGGFNVSSAPCLAGEVSYAVTPVVGTASAPKAYRYDVSVTGVPASQSALLPEGTVLSFDELIWTLRWAGTLSAVPPQCVSCAVVAVDATNGFVSVRPLTSNFTVSAALL